MIINSSNSDLVTVDWLHSNFDNPKLTILDATVNKKINSESIQIPDAIFFDIKVKFSDVDAQFPSTLPSEEQFETEARTLGIDNDSFIVVYDDKGIYSSARAWWLFKTFGFHNVAVLNGGLPQWIASGYRTEHYKEPNQGLGNFTTHFEPNRFTDFNGINSIIEDDEVLIIDARSTERFKCLVDEPRQGLRRGTIPNSVNLPYTSLLNGNLLKSKEELKPIFNKLVKHKAQLVFSCGSGITACILALSATICGYENLTVYDGSWTEYGKLTE